MKRILSKTAFSLLELIIASVLVAIVVFGIFAINSVLSNSNQDYGQRYFLKSETQVTLNHILNNASMAIGSGTTNSVSGQPDKGILIGGSCASGTGGDFGCSDPNNSNTFCIHQDIPSTVILDSTSVNSPPTTPPNYNNSSTDSRWLCYTWASTYQINYCAMQYNPSLAYQGAGNCISNVNITMGPTYLGTAQNYMTSANLPTFNYSASGGQVLFSITLQNCLDNTQITAACGQPGNPQVTISGSVSPSQHGMLQS